MPNRIIQVVFAAGIAITASVGSAQTFPAKPIRLIMPYPPGGGGDLVLRPLIEKLTPLLNGHPLVIDYKPGANAVIGTEMLARAAPDGYTIGFIADPHSLNPIFRKDLPYDSVRDFAPITQLVELPFVLVAHPSVPGATLAEVVAHAKANPGKLAYASLGSGGAHYIAMEWLKKIAGFDLLHVPYQGSAPALNAVIAGQVQLMFIGAQIGLNHAKSNRLKAIAVASAKRIPVAPDLPSVAESGFPEFDMVVWFGLIAPARTPVGVVERLNTEITKVLRMPDIVERFNALGMVPAPTSTTEFGAKLRADAEKYRRVIQLTGAKGD